MRVCVCVGLYAMDKCINFNRAEVYIKVLFCVIWSKRKCLLTFTFYAAIMEFYEYDSILLSFVF